MKTYEKLDLVQFDPSAVVFKGFCAHVISALAHMP